ncbi:MAG: MAPEG family protein [Hyphomicrobiaceae bacterium]
MSQHVIIYPVLAQVLVTFFVLVALGKSRGDSFREKRASAQDVALSGDAVWNEQAVKASNNYRNQFEMPVLFYAVTAFALILRMVDIFFLTLAWLFVVTRAAHAFIHVGPNTVRSRSIAFITGAVIVLVMWLMIGAKALNASIV